MRFDMLPKIDLHCHLDGSLDIELAKQMCAEQGEIIGSAELAAKMEAPADCSSLDEYLATFTVPLTFLQSEKNLFRTAHALARNASAENTVYLETRFAPVSCMQEGLTVRDTIEAVLGGLRRAEEELAKEGRYFRSGVILCAMRHYTQEQNEEVFRAAREYLGSGVVGVDLAGAEAMFPNAGFRDLFAEAKRLGLPFTIHSGETGSCENIRDAAEFGARRLGHGTAMRGDIELMRFIASRHVGVEICPRSNVQTKAIRNLAECPVREFMSAGIPVSIGTDNRTVSSTSLTREWTELDEIFHFGEDEFLRVYTDSVEMSFAEDDVKEELLKLIQKAKKSYLFA